MSIWPAMREESSLGGTSWRVRSPVRVDPCSLPPSGRVSRRERTRWRGKAADFPAAGTAARWSFANYDWSGNARTASTSGLPVPVAGRPVHWYAKRTGCRSCAWSWCFARQGRTSCTRSEQELSSGVASWGILSIGAVTEVSRVAACRLAVALPGRPSPKRANHHTLVMLNRLPARAGPAVRLSNWSHKPAIRLELSGRS
jgi:hypothetical protein